MAQGIVLGDVVRLKSGGPAMTVATKADGTTVYCAWFDGADHKQATFAIAALEPAEVDHPKGASVDATQDAILNLNRTK